MFSFENFMTEYNMQVEAVNCTVTDLRTGEKRITTFYYPRLDNKSLENLSKYGYHVDEIGESTKASGQINLAGVFANFVGNGGLE